MPDCRTRVCTQTYLQFQIVVLGSVHQTYLQCQIVVLGSVHQTYLQCQIVVLGSVLGGHVATLVAIFGRLSSADRARHWHHYIDSLVAKEATSN